MLDAAGRCPGRKTEITKPLPVKAPNRLREQPSGMLLAETIEPDEAAVRPADRGPLLCGVPEVPRNQRSGSKAESWSRSCSSPHIRASRHSLLVSRTGGHISGRPGGSSTAAPRLWPTGAAATARWPHDDTEAGVGSSGPPRARIHAIATAGNGRRKRSVPRHDQVWRSASRSLACRALRAFSSACVKYRGAGEAGLANPPLRGRDLLLAKGRQARPQTAGGRGQHRGRYAARPARRAVVG